MLRSAFPATVQFVNGEKLLEELRAVKTDEEVEAIKRAVKIAELGMDTAIKTIKPGTMSFGADTAFPPFEFKEGADYVGFDVDWLCSLISACISAAGPSV